MKPALRAGDYMKDSHSEFRIMAVAEGYVMMRRRYAMPFVISEKEAFQKFDFITVDTGSN